MPCLPPIDSLRPRRLPAHRACLLLLLALLPVAASVAAPKTDVVVFLNGDKLTGEVKGLQRGKLSLSTDSAGTVSIEWIQLASVRSSQMLQVELANGRRYLGQTFAAAEPGRLRVAVDADDKGRELSFANVVRMDPIDQGSLIARLDGYFTGGYDYQKVNELQTFTFSGGLSHRNERVLRSIDGSTTVTTQDSAEDSSRFDIAVNNRFFLPNRRFWQGFGGFDGNDVLGLDLRTTIAGGYGTYLVQSRKQEWSVVTGLALLREDFETEETNESLEAVFGTQYTFFRYDEPEANIDGSLMLLPSLTESGRFRSELQLRSRYEIVSDLFFEISLYSSYDSDAVSETGEKSDYGVTTSLGYSF